MEPTEDLIRRLMAAVDCSACGAHYESDSVEILGHQEDLWFLSVTCRSCSTQGLVAAMVREATSEEAAAAQEVSALAREVEIERPSIPPLDLSPITSDDLLDLHRFLGGFDGDFRRLFGSR
ncbi:MAG TPA: hypothetical protein VF960_02705 [Chloroflexota bacterium]